MGSEVAAGERYHRMQWTCQIQCLIWQMVMEEQSCVQLLDQELLKYQKKTGCWACLRLLMLHLLHHWSGESLSSHKAGFSPALVYQRNCFEWGTSISEGPSWGSTREGNVGQLEYSVSRQGYGCRFHDIFRVKSPCRPPCGFAQHPADRLALGIWFQFPVPPPFIGFLCMLRQLILFLKYIQYSPSWKAAVFSWWSIHCHSK